MIMDVEQVYQLIKELPPDGKRKLESLWKADRQSAILARRRKFVNAAGMFFLSSIEEASGDSISIDEIIGKKRTRPIPLCREIIADVMLQGHFSINEIAKVLHLSHATITLFAKREVLSQMKKHPMMFSSEENQILKEFIKIVNQYGKEKNYIKEDILI